jgi:hypothetical protein
MAERNVQRRLAAILAADIAEYTRRMEADTDGTVAAWHAARADVIDPGIAEFSGRIVKHTGDGFLAEFATVQDAVNCATAMQAGLADSPSNSASASISATSSTTARISTAKASMWRRAWKAWPSPAASAFPAASTIRCATASIWPSTIWASGK